MQDSRLRYYILVEGAEKGAAAFRLVGDAAKQAAGAVNQTSGAASGGSKNINQLANSTNRAADATKRASDAQRSWFAHITRTTIQSAIVNKLFLEMVDVMGQVVEQVDNMNNFPSIMASMGQSTDDAAESMQALTTYVGQVGGNLGDATSYVTRFVDATGDVKAATAIFVGLNNALIAGGSSMEEQRLATVQFAQALERGRPDMREWRALTQNMSFQLAQVAEAMGYVNANALGEALTAGEESMAAFTTALTKLSVGTGAIAEQAQARMNGMQFAFNVLKNTLVQGLSAIVNAIGRQNIVSFFRFWTQVVIVLTGWIITLINAVASLVNTIAGLFGAGPIFGQITGDVQNVAKGLGAGADAAEGIGKGLDKAGKSAKKLNKSLAAFDQMNVLPDKESGGGGGSDDGGVGGPGFNAGQLGDLGDIFGNLGGGLQEASKWAKILAGILTALMANSLIKKLFGVSPLRGLIRGLGAGIKLAGTFGSALTRGLFGKGSGGSGVYGRAAGLGTRIGLAIRDGISVAVSGIGGVLSKALSGLGGLASRFIIAPIVGAFTSLTTLVATSLGVTMGVAAGIVAAGVLAVVAIIWLIWTNWDTIWKFITDVFSTFWGWMTGLWNTLYGIFAGPIEWLWQFISGVFIAIVAIVATALELIYKLFVGAVKLVFALLATIAGWIYDNVISPVFEFFVELWNDIVDAVQAAWNWIFEKILRPIGDWIFNNVISPVLKFFKDLWDKVGGYVSGFFSTAKNILGGVWRWIKTNVIDRVANIFSGLWDGIKNGLSNAWDGIKRTLRGASNIFKTPLNGIIDLLNKAIRGINKLKVPDWVPGLGGKGPNIPEIPKLARGGVIDQATLAVLGESGSEAVVPLENNTEWIDMLAAKINSATGGNGQPAQITIQIGEDKVASKIIDLINEKSQMSGRNKIFV